MRILIIEDEPELGATIADHLRAYYTIDLVSSGKEGLYHTQINQYDLIILDLGLPDMDGVSFCKDVRERKIAVPILILTARDSLEDKVQALDAGADDYLTKPFSFREMSARIRALLRRNPEGITGNELKVADLELNLINRKVRRAGQEISLRRKEFDLLEYLMRNAGRVVTRSMILEHVWEMGSNLFTNTIDVHIKHLRNKVDAPFEPKLIKTVSGLGYMIEEPAEIKKGGGKSG